MKTTVLASGIAVLLLSSLAPAAEPASCSVSVGVTTRTGTFRTWTNALETLALADKGLEICQDDAVLSLSDDQLAELDEAKWAKLLSCKTEFRLELLYRPDQMTRNITIFKNGKALFDQDYPNSPPSQRILKTIPNCVELEKRAAALLAPVPGRN